jgi:hypothetical protein
MGVRGVVERGQRGEERGAKGGKRDGASEGEGGEGKLWASRCGGGGGVVEGVSGVRRSGEGEGERALQFPLAMQIALSALRAGGDVGWQGLGAGVGGDKSAEAGGGGGEAMAYLSLFPLSRTRRSKAWRISAGENAHLLA